MAFSSAALLLVSVALLCALPLGSAEVGAPKVATPEAPAAVEVRCCPYLMGTSRMGSPTRVLLQITCIVVR